MRTLKSYVVNIEERIAAAERFLVKNILKGRDNPCIKNAVAELLSKKGNVGITELTENVPVGARQLQRLFQKYIGVSPKELAALIRYQYLWSDILHNPDFCVQDAVFQYGYADQSLITGRGRQWFIWFIVIMQAKKESGFWIRFLTEQRRWWCEALPESCGI